MKKLLLFFVLSLFAFSTYAQIPRTQPETLLETGSNQNNLDATGVAYLYVNPTADISITGFVAKKGQSLIVVNRSATYSVTIPHESSSSDAANRVNLDGNDYIIGPLQEAAFRYVSYDSRWVLSRLTIGSINLPPPTQQVSNITFSDIGSTGATANISRGNGDGVIVLISTSPISQFPSNNVAYTADANFGDGDNINSSGVYVIGYGDISSVVITGLSAGTIYYVTALEFATSGPLISYNFIPDFNSTNFTTLSSASTPTSQWETLSTKSYENAIEVTGTRGNGDAFLVIANDSIPVSVDPADGANYPAGSYGAGYSFGERNFSVYNGSASQFSIDGLIKDKKYWFKVMEYETTGYLYNTQAVVDSAYVAFTYDSTFTQGSGTPEGQTYSEGQSYSYYDFPDLSGADEANISNGDPGLGDQSPLSNVATVQGTTPQVNEVTLGGAARKGARTGSGTGIDTNHDGDAWASNASGFEVHAAISLSDGIIGSSGQYVSLCGVLSGSIIHIRISHLGALQINYRQSSSTNTTVWQSSSPVTSDGLWTGVIQVRLDFATDVFSAFVNGSAVSGSVISGDAISSIDPTVFNSAHDFVIGNLSSSGSLVSNTNGATITTIRFKTTALLTAQERQDIYEWFSFQAVGSSFNDWDVTEGTGFDYVTENDTLKLSNGSAAFTDYLKHVDVLPDSLQEVEVSCTFKIASASTTNASSFIIGLRNLTTSEANYGVWGHLNLDTDGSFGRIQIFSGTGVSGDGNWAYRAGTLEGTPVALDSVFTLKLQRTINGNDAFYSLRLFDRYDVLLLTVGWLETNRPSSQFYGTTMRPFIGYQGDTDIHVAEFYVLRIGEAQVDTSPPPTPTVGNAYVVASGGDDADDCTETEPCASIPRGIERIVELGGSDRTLILSSGVHTINTSLILPTNLGLMQGAGAGVTYIVGTSNLNQTFIYPAGSQTSALIQSVSSSPITTTNHLKGFTLSGGAYQARLKAIGVYVKNRDGFEIENVNLEYFNSAALVVDGTDDVTVLNCNFIDGAGSSGSSSGPNLGQDPLTGYPRNNTDKGNYATGAITWNGNISGFTWIGGTVTATNYGGGYGSKSVGTAVQHNDWHIDGVRFYLHPRTSGSTGTNFAIELHTGLGDATAVWGDLEIENCYFNNCAISLGVHQNAVGAYTHRIHHNEWEMNNSEAAWCVEIDASNLEIDHNYFHSVNCRMWPYSRYHALRTSNDHHYHNNLYEVGNGNASHRYLNNSGGVMNDILIENETINFLTASGSKWEFWTIAASSQAGNVPNPNPSTNVTIQDVALYGDNPGNSNFWNIVAGSGGFSGSVLRNCRSTHINILQTATGVTNSNNSIISSANWFNLTGPKFDFTSDGYYYPKSVSPLLGVGNGGDTPGAVQP